jgi:hypothetical protein
MGKIRFLYVLFGISPRIWNELRTYTEVPPHMLHEFRMLLFIGLYSVNVFLALSNTSDTPDVFLKHVTGKVFKLIKHPTIQYYLGLSRSIGDDIKTPHSPFMTRSVA